MLLSKLNLSIELVKMYFEFLAYMLMYKTKNINI